MSSPIEVNNRSLAANAVENELIGNITDMDMNDDDSKYGGSNAGNNSIDTGRINALNGNDNTKIIHVNNGGNEECRFKPNDKVLIKSKSANKWGAGTIQETIDNVKGKFVNVQYYVDKTMKWKRLDPNGGDIKKYDIRNRHIECICNNSKPMEYKRLTYSIDNQATSRIMLKIQCSNCDKRIKYNAYYFECSVVNSGKHFNGYVLCIKCAVKYVFIVCVFIFEYMCLWIYVYWFLNAYIRKSWILVD